MKYITLLAGASTALAAALSIAAPEGKTVLGLPEGYAWSVQNWHAGCARSGCSYNFNVTGPQSDYIPAFTAYCYGEDKAFFKLCDILEGNGTEVKNIPFVAASLKPSTGDGAPMSVSLQFVDAATGYANSKIVPEIFVLIHVPGSRTTSPARIPLLSMLSWHHLRTSTLSRSRLLSWLHQSLSHHQRDSHKYFAEITSTTD